MSASDGTAATLVCECCETPLPVGLELTDAHQGPRFAFRTADDFWAWVHPRDGSVCRTHVGDDNQFCFCESGRLIEGGAVRRFEYLGPTWEVRS